MNVLIPSRYMPSDYVQSVYLRNICRNCGKPVEYGYLYYIAVSLTVETVKLLHFQMAHSGKILQPEIVIF